MFSYNDDITAELNMKVLQEFMTRIHPRYASRDFFITGESYAGAYIPHLSQAILRGVKNGQFTNDHFKGIAIGNSGMDALTQKLSVTMQLFALGMIPQRYSAMLFKHWRDWQTNVDFDSFLQLHEDLDAHFQYLYDAIRNSTEYNLGLVCEEEEDNETYHIAPPVKDLECSMDSVGNIIAKYLKREDVQKALHVIKEGKIALDWTSISHSVFEMYDIFDSYDTVRLYKPIFDEAKAGFRILLYTGDLDTISSALHVSHGSARIAAENELEELTESPKIWRYLGDFGGARTSYKSARNITFDVITVRGAGHQVPISYPSRAFQIINNFLFSTETQVEYSKKIRRRNFERINVNYDAE